MENNNNEKVMSDEQIETLWMQIASHNNIYRMLADFHNCRLTLQPPCRLNLQPPCCVTLEPPLPDLPFPEVEVENTQTLHGDQRRRWTSTREQIEILESIFKEGEVSHPNKEKIKEITAVLSQYGQVSDANVYTWFNNRRAQLKKKMHDQNKQMMMKTTYRIDHDQLVSTSSHCYYNNDDDDNNNDDDDDDD